MILVEFVIPVKYVNSGKLKLKKLSILSSLSVHPFPPQLWGSQASLKPRSLESLLRGGRFQGGKLRGLLRALGGSGSRGANWGGFLGPFSSRVRQKHNPAAICVVLAVFPTPAPAPAPAPASAPSPNLAPAFYLAFAPTPTPIPTFYNGNPWTMQ